MDFPEVNRFCLPVVSIFSKYAGFGPMWLHTNGTAAGSSTAWPANNRALFVPIFLPGKFNLAKFWCVNGGTVAGNIDMGLLGVDGTLIASTGSVPQAGTTAFQIVDPAGGARWVRPGRYYMALAASTTGAFFQARTPTTSTLMRGGMLQAASQVPLANLPTFASPASAYLPHFGISQIATF